MVILNLEPELTIQSFLSLFIWGPHVGNCLKHFRFRCDPYGHNGSPEGGCKWCSSGTASCWSLALPSANIDFIHVPIHWLTIAALLGSWLVQGRSWSMEPQGRVSCETHGWHSRVPDFDAAIDITVLSFAVNWTALQVVKCFNTWRFTSKLQVENI